MTQSYTKKTQSITEKNNSVDLCETSVQHCVITKKMSIISNKKILHLILLICFFGQSTLVFSQSVAINQLKNKQALTLNGFISTNQVLNYLPADSGNVFNYNSYYSGSLNFNIYGINAPVSFMYTNRKADYTLPFNQFSVHPSYKRVKTHIGYANMTFSPYTLSGHLFFGGGLELDPPGLIKISALYGRFKRAVAYDTSDLQTIPSYKRMGYGIKIGIEKNGEFTDVSFLRVFDVLNSVSVPNDSIRVLPEENTVMSVSFNKSLIKNLQCTGEFAGSMLTTDMFTEEDKEKSSFLNPLSWFMPVRTTTINRKAIKANIDYNKSKYSLGIGYERVDPDYRTLGAYFFNNNLENLTLHFSVNFLKGKLSVNGNSGLQRDNLDKSKMNNNTRFVSSGNINFVPDEKININASYSNFSSYTNVKSTFDYINSVDPYENWDTLNYRQISQNLNSSLSYRIADNKKSNQSLSFNMMFQTSNEKQGNDSTGKSSFYNTGTAYIVSLKPYDFNISATVNFNYNKNSGNKNNTWGPNVNLSKMFLSRSIKTNLSFGYNTSTTNNIKNGAIWNTRCGITYNLKKKHNFNFNFLFQLRKNRLVENTKYKTSTLTFSYVYNFQIIKQKQKTKDKKL